MLIWEKKMKLKKQLHVREDTLDLNRIKPVQNQEGIPKPKNGFWTSTYICKVIGSRFQQELQFTGGKWYILEPKDARICIVNTDKDVYELLDKYGRSDTIGNITYIDFEKLSRDFDAIHLTNSCFKKNSPVLELKLNNKYLNIHNPFEHPFYQWAAESTLWFRPKFDIIKLVEKRSM
jgi:hypothetical protein